MADQSIDRYELWDDLECAGGTRQDFIRDWLEAGETSVRRGSPSDGDRGAEAVGEPGSFELPVAMADRIWDVVREGWVVRQVFENAPYVEWPIGGLTRNLSTSGERFGVLRCHGVMKEMLLRSAMLERVEANGAINPHFELYQFPPTDHLDVILEALPSWWAKGTVEPTVPVDMVYHRDTALSAVKELAAVSEFADGRIGAELDVRRNGTTGYLIDLVRQVGAAAAEVQIREAKQLLEASTKSEIAAVATRIYPKGGNTYAYEGSMARAQWEVSAQSTATLTMRDDIVGEDDQLNGLFVLDPSGNSYEIADSVAPATIVLTADPGVDLVGDLLRFRRDVNGTLGELSYLESPSGVATFGTRSHELDRTDIPAIDNLMEDPFFLEWEGSLPRFANLVGSPLVEKETDPLYNRAGEASVHVTANEGQGVESVAADVIPTADQPFFVAQIQLYVVSGHVRLELVDVTNGTTFPPPEQEAVTTAEGRWIDSFGVAPGGEPTDNFFTRGTGQFRLRVIAQGGPAEFYLDAWMLLQQQSFSEEFYGGRASNDLWMLANDALQKTGAPEEAYKVDLVDLYRLRQETGASFVGEEIVVGGDCRVVADSIDVDFTTRIVEVRRNWSREGDTKVTLQEKTNDLTRLVNPASRRNRRKLQTETGEAVPIRTECTNLIDRDEASIERQSTDSAGREIFYDQYPDIPIDTTPLEVGDFVGWAWEGKIDPTGGTGGEVSTDGKQQRTTVGLIDRDRFNRPSVGGDWTTRSGSFSIYDDRHLYTTGGVLEWSAQTPRNEQATEKRVWLRDAASQAGRVYAKWDHNASNENSYYAALGTGFLKLIKDVNGTPTEIAAVALTIESQRWYTIKIYVADGVQKIWLDGTLQISETDTAHDGATGIPALGAADPNTDGVFFDDIIFCPNNTITMSGLPTGYKVSTSDGAGPATESSGTATLDLEGSRFTGTIIEVDNGADERQSNFFPSDGVFGGDTYLYDDTGSLDDESEFGLASHGALSFLDSEKTEISNTEGLTEGVRTTTYSRGEGMTKVPAGTEFVSPYAVRLGAAQGIAYLRRFQVNLGRPCTFRIPDKCCSPLVGAGIPAPAGYWSFDQAPPPDGVNQNNVLERTVIDRSGNGNNGFIGKQAFFGWGSIKGVPGVSGRMMDNGDGAGYLGVDPSGPEIQLDNVGTGFSLSLWNRVPNLQEHLRAGCRVDASADGYEFSITNNGAQLNFAWYDTTDTLRSTNIALDPAVGNDELTHIVVTVSAEDGAGNATVSVYLGLQGEPVVLAARKEVANMPVKPGISAPGWSFGTSNSAQTNPGHLEQDEVALFDKELSADEVRLLHALPGAAKSNAFNDLDDIQDGSTYGKVLQTFLASGRPRRWALDEVEFEVDRNPPCGGNGIRLRVRPVGGYPGLDEVDEGDYRLFYLTLEDGSPVQFGSYTNLWSGGVHYLTVFADPNTGSDASDATSHQILVLLAMMDTTGAEDVMIGWAIGGLNLTYGYTCP